MPEGVPVADPRHRPLPVVGQAPAERADAARNRRKILAAAARILACDGVEGLSLDALARAAGVGVGTVYRRFGDLTGLVAALVNEREHRFQTEFMFGECPAGPDASGGQRLRSFLHGLADLVEEQRELLLLGGARSRTGWYGRGFHQLRHIHLVTLLNELVPDKDTHYLADALLAPLEPGLLNYQREIRGYPLQRIKDGLDQLLTWALATRPPEYGATGATTPPPDPAGGQ